MAIYQGDELKVVSDGESIVLNGFGGNSSIRADEYFVTQFGIEDRTPFHRMESMGGPVEYIPGLRSVELHLGIMLSGEVKFGEDGLIVNFFDLFSVRDLLVEAEKKFNKRKL